MSILDKHPAPWRHRDEYGDIVDADGAIVATAENGCGLNLKEAASLILAAPELLTIVKNFVQLEDEAARLFGNRSHLLDGTRALIARIEGGT